MGFSDIADTINDAVLDAFSEEELFTLTRIQSGDGTLTFRGVLGPGAEPENQAPGAGSILAELFTKASNINPGPEKGDEISTATTVYKIVDLHKDGGLGLTLTLRQDRPVI